MLRAIADGGRASLVIKRQDFGISRCSVGNKHAFRQILSSLDAVANRPTLNALPELIVGNLRCARLAAELRPVLADLARQPTVALGSQPDLHPLVAVGLRKATAGIADDDDPSVLAVDH